MKLSNLLLSAALFLSAGAAFAAKTTTGEPFSWEKPENNKLSLTVFVISAGWDFSVYGYDADNKATELQVINTKDKAHALTLAQIEAKNIPSAYKDTIINAIEKDDYYHAYDLEIEINNEDIKTIGLMGSNNRSQEKMTVYSPTNVNNQNGNIFYALGSNTLLAFGNGDIDEGAVFMINTGAGEGGSGTVGSPLPTPVVTLLIALALGAGFVMYRNRKQQAEA